MKTANETTVQLDPAAIKADDNLRYGLKEDRINSLMEKILATGGNQDPVEVEPLAGDPKYKYRLTVGHYRHAAIAKANAAGAGLPILAIVRTYDDGADRRKRQLSENMDRENQTPMDSAFAIKKLFDEGFSRMDIRKLYSRPGGRKGNVVQPASNSWLNITSSFLQLPKPIQAKIHSGLIGTAAAYELMRVPADKRDAVIQRIEADRLAGVELEEKLEAKFLADEAKVAESLKKEQEAANSLVVAQTQVEESAKAVEAAKALAVEAYGVVQKGAKDDKAKASAKEALEKSEALVKERQKAHDLNMKALAKLQGKAKSATELAKERADKLAQAKADAKGKVAKADATVTPAAVRKAAKAEGVSPDGKVALKQKEMMDVVHNLTLPGAGPKIQGVFKLVESCFMGGLTEGQLFKELKTLLK